MPFFHLLVVWVGIVNCHFTFVSARERIVGWYHTGPKLNSNDIKINELVKRYCANSVSIK